MIGMKVIWLKSDSLSLPLMGTLDHLSMSHWGPVSYGLRIISLLS